MPFASLCSRQCCFGCGGVQTISLKKYQTFNEERRKTKIEELTKAISSQQANLQKHIVKSGTCTKVSYLIAEKLAKKGKPLIDGELIKECIVIAFNEYCPDKVNLVKEACLSHQTIDDLGDNIEGILKDKLSACVLYSLALDESIDQSDTAQLVIFIRGIDENFNIIEEMLDLCHIKGTTRGKDIYEIVNLSLDKFNIDRKNIYSITTDGAPALTGQHNGFISLFKESVDHEILSYHCLIHQQQLCAQKLNMKHLMTDLVKAVNFIRSRGLNHREFKAFLDEVGSEYEDVVYFSKVRWLSKAATLKRFQLLLPEIKVFLEKKKQNVDFLENEEWLNDLSFFVDITVLVLVLAELSIS
ncbi:general transcription factor II-I repeat domain-containing protein 2-like [Styela clava]